MTRVVVGRASVDCPHCPWPVHLALVADPEQAETAGLLPALDAMEAGVPQALRVHYKQHGFDDEGDG